MGKGIVFTKVNTAELVKFKEAEEIGPKQIRVSTCFSTISNGTEKANIMGSKGLSIFADESQPIVFPRQLGYSTSGIVTEIGSQVTEFMVGDRVAMAWTLHKTENVVEEKNAVKIPEGVDFAEASIAHIATFPMLAVRKTGLEMGESAIVMGLGILGLLAIGILRAAGAMPIIAVDPVEERRQKALKFGADYALDPYEEGFAQKVKDLTDGGAKVAIEVTGAGAGLNGVLDCMAKFGRIALLGCTRSSDFSVDYYRKVHGPGITLIGAHTLSRPEHESRAGAFTLQDDMKTILGFCERGRLDLASIIDEVHTPEECSEVYTRLINEKTFPTVVQFDWRKCL